MKCPAGVEGHPDPASPALLAQLVETLAEQDHTPVILQPGPALERVLLSVEEADRRNRPAYRAPARSAARVAARLRPGPALCCDGTMVSLRLASPVPGGSEPPLCP
jgi:hypothetical protein